MSKLDENYLKFISTGQIELRVMELDILRKIEVYECSGDSLAFVMIGEDISRGIKNCEVNFCTKAQLEMKIACFENYMISSQLKFTL